MIFDKKLLFAAEFIAIFALAKMQLNTVLKRKKPAKPDQGLTYKK